MGEHTKLNGQTSTTLSTNSISNYLEILAFLSEAAALAADLTRVVGFRTLFGLNAFRILKAAHPAPTAWPAASSPSFVAWPACSPYLQENIIQIQTLRSMMTRFVKYVGDENIVPIFVAEIHKSWAKQSWKWFTTLLEHEYKKTNFDWLSFFSSQEKHCTSVTVSLMLIVPKWYHLMRL